MLDLLISLYTCVFIVFKIVSFGILFFLAISIIDANLELVSGFESFCSEKKLNC